MLKKAMSLFLALVMALGMIPTEAIAATTLASSEGAHYEETAELLTAEIPAATNGTVSSSNTTSSENQAGPLRYIINEDGTTCSIAYCDKSISGNYEIPAEINGYAVTKIGSKAFSGCSALESVTIPKGVTSIDDYAFYECSSLERFTIPEGVTSIARYTFSRCSSLKSIIIPESVTSIGDDAFAGCSALQSISIPEGVTNIGESAFTGCSTLQSISIPKRVTSIKAGTFALCSALRNITIPEGVTIIYGFAFWGCSTLQNITIPKGVTSIPGFCFQSCSALQSITIPEGITSIGDSAFSGCSALQSITIPEGTISIGDSAFYKCSALQSITIPEGATSIGDSAFYECSTLQSVTIPEGVTSIGDSAFSGCSTLQSITIPEGTISIGNSAFYKCSALQSVTISEGVTSIGDSTFSSCSALQSVSLPEGVTNIGDRAFSGCSSLQSITIPKGTLSIGDYAFSNCFALESVDILEGVIYIGMWAFSGCSALQNITLPEGVTYIDIWAFSRCSALESITIPESVTSIGDSAFSGCSSLESITIPESVTSIGDSAFSGCSSLESITIPESVTSIGDSAFSGCSSLQSIAIPQRVTSIGNSAFWHCSSLESIAIPESVTSISNYVFYECSALQSVTIPEGVTSIGIYAFWRCSSLESIAIPESVTSIGALAFYGCSALQSVTIPEGVTSIAENTFYQCSSLKQVTLPLSIQKIENGAFNYSSQLQDVYYAGTKEDRENIEFQDAATELLQATWHYNSTGPDAPTEDGLRIRYLSEWDAENQIAYFEDELLHLGAEVTEATDTSFLDTVQDMVGHYVLVKTKARDDGMIGSDILIRMELVEAGTGTIQERTEDSLTIHDTVYPLALKGEEPLFGAGKDDEVLYGVQDGKIVILVPLTTTTMRLEDWDPDSRVLTVSSDLTTYTYKVSTLASEESLAFLNADREPDKSYNIEFAYDLSGKSVYRIYRIYMESGDEDTSYKDGTFEYLSYDNHIREYTYHYDESWFWNSSYTYQHDLTRMSLRVAMAAGDIRVVDGQADADGARPLKNLMSDLGFTYSEEYSHYPIPEYDSIGYGIGSKTITSSSGEEATLIMVAIRGSGYKSEWGGNFRIGADMDHMGFRLAADQVIEGLKNYIDANAFDFKPNVKVWISGFSRAAATTNLVAAYLDDGNFAEINPDNVFAFCFECPRNTKNADVTNSRYNNIINIVNPNDLVTKVAMSSWGFSRYGKTYLIPTRDTDSMYLKLKGDMQLEYVKILDSLENTPDVVLDLTTDYANQSDVLNKFVFNLGNALKNEDYYVMHYQNDIVENTAMLLGQGKAGALVKLLDFVRELIASREFELENSISAVAMFADGALYAHNPELCMAWLDSLEFIDTTSENLWMYRKLLINCPVDITVYDTSEQIVAQIIDGNPQEIANGLSAYVDCNGQNIIVLPANGEYTVKLKATDDGTVTYTIAEYSADSGLCNRITSYYTVAVKEGDELYGTIENLANVSEAQYPLISSDGETIIPTVTQTGSEVKSYTVNVSLIGGGSVSGGGIFTSGEYAKVVATPDKEYVFDGWYIGNRLVSKDLEYRFLVDGNITISAVFVENSTSHTMTYVEAIQATCCSTGILAHWHCSECNKDFSDADGTTEVSSIVIPIDPTNHAGGTEVRNAVEATYESEGYTGDTYCLGCNAKIADGTVIPKKTQSGSTSSGGGTSTYTITLEEFENGTVTASHKQAPHGTTVTLTITPEEGFTLESLTVRDRNDNMIRVTSKTETIYSFTMPSSPVQIAAVFSQAINDPDTPLGDLPFLDVSPEAWYKNAVGYVFENGLMSGTSSTTFSPDITASRGMIVTTLYRLEQSPSVSESSDFSDVEDGQWYSDAIIWASANDIVSGYGNGMFGPDDPVTREQMATFLYRYAQFKGYPTTSSADLSKYTDLELLSTWAQEPMKWANVFGIITGTTATTLNPQGNATRAEMAAMLMSFCENVTA